MTVIQSEGDVQSQKRKVKDLSLEEKRAFLQRLYKKSRNDNPELYAMSKCENF